jgi:hypothetical protein
MKEWADPPKKMYEKITLIHGKLFKQGHLCISHLKLS